MPVSQEQVAALRAQLASNPEEHKRLLDQLDPVAARTGYSALVAAAFSIAVEQRFGRDSTTEEVIAFVGDVRSRFDEASEEINPRAAELLIRAVLGSGSTAEFDAETKFTTQVFLLAAMVSDAQLDDAGLDAFLAEARELGDALMS